MYNGLNENELILPEVADALQDYVSIQLDIDETKVKAAAIVAQNIDIKRIIGKDNLLRCIIDPTGDEEQSDSDKQLTALIIPAWCYYTYSRLLKMFHTIFTDSGLVSASDDGAESRNAAKSLSNEMKSIAESYMLDVTEFLDEEAEADSSIDTTQYDESKLTPRIRTFGGSEWRGSN